MSKVCRQCGFVGEPGKNPKGEINWLIGFALALFYIWPGVAYLAWCYYRGLTPACAKCGSENLVPVDSPVGQKLTQGQ